MKAIPVLKGVQSFLSFLAARNDSPNTLRAYNRDLLQFVQFVGHETSTAELTRKTIRAYVVSLGASGLKRASLTRKLAVVRSFATWLLDEGHAQQNPTEGISGPRRHQEMPDVPSEANMKALLSGTLATACPSRDRLILELLYGCGLRAAELAGVNLDDFRDGNTLLVRGKGRKERLVPVGAQARSALRKWLPLRKVLLEKAGNRTTALLFSVSGNESWERLSVRSVHRVVKQACASKRLPAYHPHQLRHACATHMHDHGAPIQAISAMLGHVNLSTSELYTRVSVGRMMQTYNAAHPHAH